MSKNKRIKKHPKYYRIPAYQILQKKSDDEMAKALNMCKRSYKEKIEGYSDFTSEQGRTISKILGVSQDEIFLV